MKTIENLLQTALNWDLAIVSNDIFEISKFMSDDWNCVATDGGITTKENFINHIRCGDLVHTKMETDESKVKIYHDTGIVIGKGTSSGFYKNNPFSFYEWSSSVFIWVNNEWICVLTMLTPANT